MLIRGKTTLKLYSLYDCEVFDVNFLMVLLLSKNFVIMSAIFQNIKVIIYIKSLLMFSLFLNLLMCRFTIIVTIEIDVLNKFVVQICKYKLKCSAEYLKLNFVVTVLVKTHKNLHEHLYLKIVSNCWKGIC